MTFKSQYDKVDANKFLRRKHSRKLSHLIYRDIPSLLSKYITSGKALDFGCGPGISTRFLASLGFEIIGIDINQSMLKEAISEPDGIPFGWIQHGQIPFKSMSFDLVSSIMVFLEVPSLQIMQEAVNEIARILRPGGIFLAVVGSENFPKYNWLNKNNIDYKSYQNIQSGDVFYIYSKTTNITFKDYFYTHQNYLDVFHGANLTVIETHKALGLPEDDMPWNLEKTLNPYTHYICKKC